MAAVRDILEDQGTPTTPGVMASVVVVLAALAQLRGDIEVAGLLLEHSGRVMITEGVRTPIDIALHALLAAGARRSTTAPPMQPTCRGDELAEAVAVELGVM